MLQISGSGWRRLILLSGRGSETDLLTNTQDFNHSTDHICARNSTFRMKSALTVVLFRLFTIGVFVDGKEASNVSVMEGDSVTLKPGVTDVQKKDIIEWRFNGKLIDKFVDGLQLDSQTGDLKISNIRTEHSGLYEVQISSSRGSPEMEFNVKVVSADEVKLVSVMEGDSVTLRTDVPDIQRVDVIRWRFGKQKSPVAEINRMAGILNTFDGPDGRFRDRLELDNQTGSLIITNITTEHTGLYEAEISSTRSRYTIHYTQSFSVTGRVVESVSVLMGDSVTLRTGLTEKQRDDKIRWKFGDQDIARLKTWSNIDLNSMTGDLTISNIQRNQRGHYKVEIITRRMILHRKYNCTITIGEMKTVSVKEGASVTLQIVTEIQSNDLIHWMFGNFNLVEFNKKEQRFYTSDGPDERFRGRLKLDRQTGSLTITNTRTTDSELYHLEIISSRHIINRRITVTVSGVFGDKDEVMSVMKGNPVTLNTGVTKNPDDTLLWYFEDTLIALVNRHPNTSCLYYGKDEIFKDRLEVDYKTGSLIITTSRPEHTGRYQAEFIEGKPGKTETIIRSSKCDHTKIYPKGSDLVIHKSFNLTVRVEKLGPSLAVSSDEIAGIVVGVVLLVAVAVGVIGVMIYLRRSSRNDIKKTLEKICQIKCLRRSS